MICREAQAQLGNLALRDAESFGQPQYRNDKPKHKIRDKICGR
jgi:hypothetical protein